MAAFLRSRLSLAVISQMWNDPSGAGVSRDVQDIVASVDFASAGVSALNSVAASKHYGNRESLPLLGRTYTLNALTGFDGSAISLAKIKLLAVKNLDTANYLNVGGTFPPVSGDPTPVYPGGVLLLCAPTTTGYAVTGAETIALSNPSGDFTPEYEIIIIGD